MLKIIDAKDHISEDTSLDSFISGFRLAWRLSAELNHYDDERPARCQAAEKPGARFTFKKEDDELAWPCVPLCGRSQTHGRNDPPQYQRTPQLLRKRML